MTALKKERARLPNTIAYLFMGDPDRRAAVWHYSYVTNQQSPSTAEELWDNLEAQRELVIGTLIVISIFAAIFVSTYLIQHIH